MVLLVVRELEAWAVHQSLLALVKLVEKQFMVVTQEDMVLAEVEVARLTLISTVVLALKE